MSMTGDHVTSAASNYPSREHRPRFELTDDGTLDTVLLCNQCGEQLRYTFGGVDEDGPYEAFVEWCKEDAEEVHECE